MKSQELFNKFESLPLEAQKQVLAFVDFLQNKYQVSRKPKQSKKFKFKDEKFIGLWQGRNDLEESTKWVRKLRTNEYPAYKNK